MTAPTAQSRTVDVGMPASTNTFTVAALIGWNGSIVVQWRSAKHDNERRQYTINDWKKGKLSMVQAWRRCSSERIAMYRSQVQWSLRSLSRMHIHWHTTLNAYQFLLCNPPTECWRMMIMLVSYLSSFGLPSVTITLNCFVSAAFNSSATTTRELPWTRTVLPSCKREKVIAVNADYLQSRQ